MFGYRAYGLNFQTSIAFPELKSHPGPADVFIRQDVIQKRSPHDSKEEVDDVRILWKDLVAIRVKQGREITFQTLSIVEEGWLRQCLLGPGLGILLHQRGLLVLHASAVSVKGEGMLFLGQKGEGKSTIAAALHSHGHSLLADDIVAVDVSDPSCPLIIPGFSQIKVWPDTAEAVKAPPRNLSLFHSQIEKRCWRVADISQAPVPLARIFILEAGEVNSIVPLTSKQAFAGIMPHLYASRFLGATCVKPEHLQFLADVIRKTSTFQLKRVMSLERLSEVTGLVVNQ